MKWIDGTEIDIKHFSGESLCHKLLPEILGNKEIWSAYPDFLHIALFISDFDRVTKTEGFTTPYDSFFTSEEYSEIIKAFQAIGDNNDANLLEEALRLDVYYTGILNSSEDENTLNKAYYEFRNKQKAYEKNLYLNTGFDIWALLYKYIDEQIDKL